MRPGTTVFEWMQDHDVRSIGVDVRRFASFGVIKVKVPSISLARAPTPHFQAWSGLPPPHTPLADPSRRRRTTTTTTIQHHRRQADDDWHTASLAYRSPQARQQPNGATPAHVYRFYPARQQTAHLRRNARIRDRKRALDKRYRLAPSSCSRSVTWHATLAYVGGRAE